MNFNIYLDESTVERLNNLAREKGTTRNALIREAVGHLLDRQDEPGWPSAVTEYLGTPDAPVFESARRGLRPAKKDPLR